MKESFRKIIENTDPKEIDGFFDGIKEEKVSASAAERIKAKAVGETAAKKSRFRWMPVVAAAAVVALAVAAVPVINGLRQNLPKVTERHDPVTSVDAPADSQTPPSDDPVSEPIPPVSSDIPSVDDPVSNDVTEPAVSETPSVTSDAPSKDDPVSSFTPSKNDPVSSVAPVVSDPPVSSSPDVDRSNVIWYVPQNGPVGDEVTEPTEVNGLHVSESLYKALQKDKPGVYGIVVRDSKGYVTGDDADAILAICDFAEIRNGKLFILPTKEEFINLNLTDEQKENYFFALTSKAYYTGIPSVTAPVTDISDWENINPEKFAVYASDTYYANSYADVETLKLAYEDVFSMNAWVDDPIIEVFCYLRDKEPVGPYLQYLDYDAYYQDADPSRASVTMKLSKLDFAAIQALSDDDALTWVFITRSDAPIAE